MVVQAHSSEDLKSLLEKAGDKLVVIDFYATWCGPCKMIAPKIGELEMEMTTVVFLKVDVDEFEDVIDEYGVNVMPTFIFMKEGKVLEKFSGANYPKLRSTIEKYL